MEETPTQDISSVADMSAEDLLKTIISSLQGNLMPKDTDDPSVELQDMRKALGAELIKQYLVASVSCGNRTASRKCSRLFQDKMFALKRTDPGRLMQRLDSFFG